MKKSLIAGAASLAIAAMPVVGVFAAGEGTVTKTTIDSLSLTIPKGCNIQTDPARSDTEAAFGNVAPGQTATDGTSAIVVTCNGAWTLTPSIKTALTNGTATIASGATALDGTVSEWALQLTAASLPTGSTNDFSSYAAVNGTNKVVGAAASSALSITPSYKVSVAPGQATGTYGGEVLYTVAETN